jgi:hypothetical protein
VGSNPTLSTSFLKEDKMAKQSVTADPMKTKTGKTRLGPLNLSQLKDMLEKTSRPKDKGKIQNRIRILESRVK